MRRITKAKGIQQIMGRYFGLELAGKVAWAVCKHLAAFEQAKNSVKTALPLVAGPAQLGHLSQTITGELS